MEPTQNTVPSQSVLETPQVDSASLPPKKDNKMLMLGIFVLLLILIAVGAFYVKDQSNNSPVTEDTTMTTEENIITATPTPTITDEEEIENIEIEASDSSELEAIEKDINSL